MQRFSGKVVIVTGSSKGIGRATAVLFAREGARLVLHGRDEKALQEARCECEAAGTTLIVSVRGDLTDETVQKELIDTTLDKFGAIDVLVNNAGAAAPDMSGAVLGFEQPLDNFDYVIALNTKSALRLTLLAMPHLERAQGEVIMVSSICGLARANSGLAFYAASKAALDQLTRALAVEYIKKGVRVNGVSPGIVTTTIFEKLGLSKDEVAASEAHWMDEFLNCPMRRSGRSEEIAALIAFLADRKTCGYIIGQSIVIDGGSTLVCPLLAAIPRPIDG